MIQTQYFVFFNQFFYKPFDVANHFSAISNIQIVEYICRPPVLQRTKHLRGACHHHWINQLNTLKLIQLNKHNKHQGSGSECWSKSYQIVNILNQYTIFVVQCSVKNAINVKCAMLFSWMVISIFMMAHWKSFVMTWLPSINKAFIIILT